MSTPTAVVRLGDGSLSRSVLVERAIYLARSADYAGTSQQREARLAEASRLNVESLRTSRSPKVAALMCVGTRAELRHDALSGEFYETGIVLCCTAARAPGELLCPDCLPWRDEIFGGAP